jgi:high-affinity iron transporter
LSKEAAVLLNSVVIVLREVLEAALMISILLATSRRLRLSLRWLVVAIVVGLAGAIAYARFLGAVSELFDGVGQELLNATLQVGVFLSLLIVVFLVVGQQRKTHVSSSFLPVMMAATVALAVSQEGAEIIIYVFGFVQMSDFLSSVAVGSIAGAGIGFSVGVLFYYLLLALPAGRALWISLSLLGLVGASMCGQATKLLIQADWLSAATPIWDTSWLIGEDSLFGQLLYALIGYEATPSLIEVAAYVGGLGVIIIAALLGWSLLARRTDQSL